MLPKYITRAMYIIGTLCMYVYFIRRACISLHSTTIMDIILLYTLHKHWQKRNKRQVVIRRRTRIAKRCRLALLDLVRKKCSISFHIIRLILFLSACLLSFFLFSPCYMVGSVFWCSFLSQSVFPFAVDEIYVFPRALFLLKKRFNSVFQK